MLLVLRNYKFSNRTQLMNRKYQRQFDIGESINNFRLKGIENLIDYNLVGYEWEYMNGVQYYHFDSEVQNNVMAIQFFTPSNDHYGLPLVVQRMI